VNISRCETGALRGAYQMDTYQRSARALSRKPHGLAPIWPTPPVAASCLEPFLFPYTAMDNDFPELYEAWKIEDGLHSIMYVPDGESPTVLCRIPGRDDTEDPDEDAAHRANVIANLLNATVDMSLQDIRELLDTYIEHYGKEYYADPRSKN